MSTSGTVQHEYQHQHHHHPVQPVNRTTDNRRNSDITNSLPSSTSDNFSPAYGVHLRAKLRFFFMSPCWKWHLKRQVPWKAWFQVLKVIIVTTQVHFFNRY